MPFVNDDLVTRAKSGDRHAMEQLLDSVAPSIRRFARRMCRHEADAEDVLQDALLSIATHLDAFEARSTLPSWAFAITRSACARRRRGKKNQPAEPEDVLATRPTGEPSPLDAAEKHQLGALVTQALEALPDEHREVLLLRDVEGMSGQEAAAALGVSIDALKSRLHRARSALRDVLRPVLEAEAPARGAGCPDVVQAFSRKLEGELDASTCAEMEAHVRDCGSCGRTCDALEDALAACRAAPAALTPELEARVRATVERWIEARTK